MDGWNRQANRDRDVLMRIVALLVSLAGFADRAGELSGRRRDQLLQILCYAETVGRDLIFGLMSAASIQYDDTELDADPEPPVTDAARFAASLRVLALVLYTMLQRRFVLPGAICPSDWQNERPAGNRSDFGPPVRCVTALAPDTS